ncbi:MAG: M23 family metallopeptidase [Chrysiogenales bacterium]
MIFSTVLLAAQGNEKKYVWPLTIDNGISSTFQEFRANHFHAGIDLRTFQATGYPVLAIADGMIEKIIMSWSGIGRAIFLRHNDGNLSIYGHLEKFRDDIESLAAREQIRRGEKYFGEFVLPEPLAVRQGVVIAFSGESGEGFPHLHLEIRDKLAGALNPQSFISNLPPDNYAPVVQGILLRSRGNSLLNDEPGELYFKLLGDGSAYTLAAPLTVTGPFDLVLQAFDLSDVRHVVAPYSIEAYLDGRLYYQITFNRLIRDDNNQLGMLYDMAYSTSGTYYYKLFFQSGFGLEKGKSPFAENFKLLPPGLHEIKVIVKDRQQNQAIALIPLQKLSDSEGVFIEKKYNLKANENRALYNASFSTYINRDDVIIKIKDFARPASWIKLKIIQGDQEQTVAAKEYGAGVYFCFNPLNNAMRLQLRFLLSNGQQALEELQKNIQLLVLKPQTARQFHYGDFIADFAAKTVLEPTVMLLENEQLGTEFPLLAGPMSIGPAHFAFLDTVVFKFKTPQERLQPEQMGIFKYQPLLKRWKYIQTFKVPETGYLGCRVLNGGIFALLRDICPPEIQFRSRRTRHFENCKKLVVHLRDRGKGIDDRTVAVFLNGQKVDSEYDPDWDHILINDIIGLQKGKNDLLVQAADFAGNRSKKKFYFHLK